MAAVDRRRLDEDIRLANVQLLTLQGKTVEAIPELKRLAVSVTERDDPVETLLERMRPT